MNDEQYIQELIDRCLQHDRKAQERLYRFFYRFALTVAIRYSKDEMDAAEILSHAFVSVFRSITNYDRTKGSLHAWIRRIVINEGLDHLNQRKRIPETVPLDRAGAPVIDNTAVEKMSATDVMRFVRELPPATHAVFVLFAIEGYQHKEIAERLGISEGTSKWHLSEARKILQKKLLTHSKNGEKNYI